jgi:uncharacterized membrane protein YvbJ
MYCKHCGKRIDNNSIFCKYCGKQLVHKQKISIEFHKPNIKRLKESISRKKDSIIKDSSQYYKNFIKSDLPNTIGCLLAIICWILLFCYGVLGCF